MARRGNRAAQLDHIAVVARGLAIALSTVLLATGCAAAEAEKATPAAPLHAVYVGRVAGSSAFVAVAVDRGKSRAYLCDSRKTAAWFAGSIPRGRFDLHARGIHLRGRLNGDRAGGTVTFADGSVAAFHARRAPGGGGAGLYRAEKTVEGVRYVAGWILLPGRAQRGNVVALTPSRSTTIAVRPAPPLDPKVTEGSVATVNFDFPANVG